jgi:colanic acid/amylovoran biosynthesis protein
MDLLRTEFGPETAFVIHESQPRVASRYYPEYELHARAYRVVSRMDRPQGRRQRLAQDVRLTRFRVACELWARGLATLARPLLTPAERRLVADFVEADLVVTTGGTYLVEHYDFTSRLFALETARRLRRPLVFFTQSLGPFTRPDTRRDVGRAVESAELVLLRDERSLRHLRDLGVRDGHLQVTADVVFAIADEVALGAARARGAFPGARPDGGPPRVAISVREWAHFARMTPEAGMAAFRAAIGAAVTYLVERHGAHITFVSTCQGVREYWTDDSRTALEIVAELQPHVRKAVEVDRGFHRPAELAAWLREFDLVVTTRMHMAILALGVGTLVFPVAYEFKTRELFDRLGLGEYVHDMEGVRADAFVRTLGEFLDDAARVRETMFAGVDRERRSALASGALVRRAMNGRGQPSGSLQ